MFFEIVLQVFVFLLTLYFLRRSQEVKEQSDQLFFEEARKNTKFVTIEQVEQSGKTYFLVHTFEEEEFVAQGFSEQEALENTKTRFPDMNIFLVTDNK